MQWLGLALRYDKYVISEGLQQQAFSRSPQ